MSKNILISALGAQPIIITETIGYTNFCEHNDYYAHKKAYNSVKSSRCKCNIEPVDELWLIATDKQSTTQPNGKMLNSTIQDIEFIQRTCNAYVNNIKVFILKGIHDIISEQDALAFRDLAFRVICFAQEYNKKGKLYLSLACGRKTMSADIQEAAYCFGCDALIHVLGDTEEDALPINLGPILKNEALQYNVVEFNINEDIIYCYPETSFAKIIEQQKKETQNFYTTYFLDDSRNNFPILYTLSKSKIEELKNTKIGTNKVNLDSDFSYLKQLPKTDLHCHLGGVLDTKGMVEVAKCYIPEIEKEKKINKAFREWGPQYNNQTTLKDWYNKEASKFNVPKGIIVSSFLLGYEGKEEELDKLIFGNYVNPMSYKNIGIINYAQLGDLQGSALLCHEGAIRKTIQLLLKQCKEHNVKYIEIRCSPINYQTENLSAKQILWAIFEELEKEKEVESSVIMIATRHGDVEKIKRSIDLVKAHKEESLFKKYFRGFDLAGAEEMNRPRSMHSLFLEIMEDCYNITIHAGETAEVENIWEAVYYLNAERIGHGLKLIERPDLMDKFLQRGIGIEICPSSNFQIVGYRNNYHPKETKNLEIYPLKEYLEKELLVSVNTDNPGISRTNATKELLTAAQLTTDGLSKWDILQLIYNGFKTSFYPYEQKKQLIKKVEKQIKILIEENKL